MAKCSRRLRLGDEDPRRPLDDVLKVCSYAQAASCPNERLMQCLLTSIYSMREHPSVITFRKSSETCPVAYVDADLGTCRSQTGYCFFYANACILAVSKVQRCITLSACESELVALSAAACDAIWLRNLLVEIGKPMDNPTRIYCDNLAARTVAHNPTSAKNLKHVARRHFFVQDLTKTKEVVVPGVESANNYADILTKLYDSPTHFEYLAGKLRSWDTAT